MLAENLRVLKSTLQTAFNTKDRRAKIQDGDFIIALLHATAVGSEKFSLASLRLSVCDFLGIVINQSAFNERMGTDSLLRQVQHVLGVLMQRAHKTCTTKQANQLARGLGVESINAVDGSLVSLWDGLLDTFKGTFMTSAIKLHLAIDLVTGVAKWFDLTPGATHDSQRFPSLQSGQLYVTDLGYWSVRHFSNIMDAGGFFLSRLKGRDHLIVTDVVSGGFGKTIIGQNLKDFLIQRRRGEIVEFRGELGGDKLKIPVRVIGFWHPEECRYLWYVTNLKAPRSSISQLYRLRWQIELSFKAMKSIFHFDRIPTLSPNTTQTLCLLGICHYILSTILRNQANSETQSSANVSLLRASTVLRSTARGLYGLLKLGTRITARKLKWISSLLLPLIGSYHDPNSAKRPNTLMALEVSLG